MSQNEIDNKGGLLADQRTPIGQAQQAAEKSEAPNISSAYGGTFDAGQNSTGRPAFPALSPDRLRQERQEKMTALLSGSYTPPASPADPEYHSVMDPTPAKSKPWIGPDGGMLGRGFKAFFDWYGDYVHKWREGLIKTMNAELNDMFRPQLIDGVNTWAHGMLTLYTGIDTGFEPQFGLNKLFMPNAWFNTGSGTPPVMGFQYRVNPLLPLLVTGARWWGDQNLKPSEIWNGAKAGLVGATGGGKSSANQEAQQIMKNVDGVFNAFDGTVNIVKDQLK